MIYSRAAKATAERPRRRAEGPTATAAPVAAWVGVEVALVLVKLMGVRVAGTVGAAVVLLNLAVKPAEAVVLATWVEDDDKAVVVVFTARRWNDEVELVVEVDVEVEDDDEVLVEVTGGRAATETTAPSHSDRGLPTGQQSCSPLALLAQ